MQLRVSVLPTEHTEWDRETARAMSGMRRSHEREFRQETLAEDVQRRWRELKRREAAQWVGLLEWFEPSVSSSSQNVAAERATDEPLVSEAQAEDQEGATQSWKLGLQREEGDEVVWSQVLSRRDPHLPQDASS